MSDVSHSLQVSREYIVGYLIQDKTKNIYPVLHSRKQVVCTLSPLFLIIAVLNRDYYCLSGFRVLS